MKRLKGFDYGDVKLLDGRMQECFQEMITFYMGISNDDIFRYMRQDAGLDAPGKFFQGWYVKSRGTSLIGQWISAFARMYAATGNKECREKAVFLAEEFWNCYELLKDTPKKLLHDRSFYAYEKLLQAHCDLYSYCNYKEAAERIPWMINFAVTQLGKENIFGDNGTEWYTMSEALYTAYEIFGLEEAKKAAELWEYREFWDIFYCNLDPFSKKPKAGLYSEFCHAYSHTNSFNSCAKAYEIKQDPYYLKALRGFYNFMMETEVMATGGFGPNFEHLMPKNRIIDALRTGHDSFETQCGSYAAYRLIKYLTRFTGEPQFGNWGERLLWNATLSTIPMTEDGKVIYYSDYNMYGASKINRQDPWTCCTGTRPLAVIEIPRMLYYTDDDDLFVSQYASSELHWDRAGQAVTVIQQTSFPETDTSELSFRMESPKRFAVRLRMPDWLAGKMEVIVNGSPVSVMVDKEGWLTVEREWKDGDHMMLKLPMQVWMHAFDTLNNGPNAFLYGPVVLAADYTGIQTPNDWMDVRQLLPKMKPAGKPLHYRVEGRDDLSFKPFYEYKEYERYFLYHDTSAHAGRNR